MSEPFVGEIRMFAGNFAPRGWAFCDGQLLAVSQNDALFSLLGTIYGGDGRTTFGLPGLRGRTPIHAGHGPGLSNRSLGAKSGEENVTLITNQLPSHTHSIVATTDTGDEAAPAGRRPSGGAGLNPYRDGAVSTQFGTSGGASPNGDSQSHTNMMPTLVINFIIALVGIYPSRN